MIDDSLTLHRFFLITLKHRKDGNLSLIHILHTFFALIHPIQPTFAVNGGWMGCISAKKVCMSWEQAREMAQAGHCLLYTSKIKIFLRVAFPSFLCFKVIKKNRCNVKLSSIICYR